MSQPIFENTPSMRLPPGVDYIALLAPDLTPDEAARVEKRLTEIMKTQYAAVEAATRVTEEAHELCNENNVHKKFLAGATLKAEDERNEFMTQLRGECFALRGAFAGREQAEQWRKLADTAELFRSQLDHHVSGKSPMDDLNHLDRIVDQRADEFALAETVAQLSYVRTVARLGAAYEEEGGSPRSLGILGRRTTELQQAAKAAGYAWKSAADAARDARARYEKQQAAIIDRGIFTSSNARNAIPKF